MDWTSLHVLPAYLEKRSDTQSPLPFFRTHQLSHIDGTRTYVVNLFQYPGIVIRNGVYVIVMRFVAELRKRVKNRRRQTKWVSVFTEQRTLRWKAHVMHTWLRAAMEIKTGHFQIYSKSVLTRYFRIWYINYLHSKAMRHRLTHVRSKGYRQQLNLAKERIWRIWTYPLIQKRRANSILRLKLLTHHFQQWKLAYIAHKNQDLLEEFVYYQLETIHLTCEFRLDEWKGERSALVIGDLVRVFNFEPIRELVKINRPDSTYMDIDTRLSLIQKALKSQITNWLSKSEEEKPGVLNKHQIKYLLRKYYRSPRPFLFIFKQLREKKLQLNQTYILHLIYIHLESSITNMRKLVIAFRRNLGKYRKVEVNRKYQDVVLLKQLQELQEDIFCSPSKYLQGTSKWSQLHVIYELPILSLSVCGCYLSGMLSTTIKGRSINTNRLSQSVSVTASKPN